MNSCITLYFRKREFGLIGCTFGKYSLIARITVFFFNMNNYALTSIQVRLYVLIYHERKRLIDIPLPIFYIPLKTHHINISTAKTHYHPPTEGKKNDKNKKKNMKKA